MKVSKDITDIENDLELSTFESRAATNTTNTKTHDNGFAENKAATFEEAATQTGFGKFNIILILAVIPSIWAPIFETSTLSYTFAYAHCDLELSLEDKGYLNSIVYLGIILSSPIWGFLGDTLGRRKLLIGGYLLDAFFVFVSALTKSIIPLMICKFLGGFIVIGPYAILLAYMSEFHCSKNRSRVQLVIGIMECIGSITLPVLAWLILPQPLDFDIFSGYIKLHSWNIYLFVCGLPAFISGILFIFLPESPKFLMTMGENEKALEVFQKVYRINTGKSVDSFPIKQLVDEIKINADNKHGGYITANRSTVQALKEGWQQVKPLFFPPYLSKLILVCFIQCSMMQSINTMRLWTPQIFQALDDYEHYYNSSTNLCTALELLKLPHVSDECTVNTDNSKVYINSIIVAATTMCAYILTGFIINILGKKKVTIIFAFISGTTCCTIFLSQNALTTVALSSLFLCLTSVCSYVTIAAIVDIFPTSLRTLTVSITIVFSRGGSLFGTLFFPALLRLGCAYPFVIIGSIVIVSALCCFLLPNTENKSLK